MSVVSMQPNKGWGDHGEMGGLGDDDHTQYLLLAGRAGGQVAYGDTASLGTLELHGTTNADLGFIDLKSPVRFSAYTANPNALYAFDYPVTEIETVTVGYIGGGLNFSGDITFSNGVFIYESFRGSPAIRCSANHIFAAYTVLQALPQLHAGSGAAHNPLSPLILNAGPAVNHYFTGTRTCGNVAAVNFSPTIRSRGTGSVLNVTNLTGMTLAPKYDVTLGETMSFGTIRGLRMQNPGVALFGGSAAGTKAMTACYGIDFEAMAFGGNVPKVVVRSLLAAASNAYFLNNLGGAQSNFGAGRIYTSGAIDLLSDANKFTLGASQDGEVYFDGSNLILDPDPVTVAAKVYIGAVADDVLACGSIQLGPSPATEYFISTAGYLQMWFGTAWEVYITGGTMLCYFVQDGGTNGCIFDLAPDSFISCNTAKYIYLNDTGAVDYIEMMEELRNIRRRVGQGADNFPSITPTALAADANDWAGQGTGANMREVVRAEATGADRTVTGLAVQRTADTVYVINIGATYNVTLSHQSGSSSASNRIISPTGADLVLGPDEYAFLWHDDTTDRWRVLDTNGA